MIWQFTTFAALAACCGYALIFGGRPERTCAALMIVALALTWLAQYYFGTFFETADMAVMAIDVALLMGFVTLALLSNRYWPLWVSGFHLVGTVTHTALLGNSMITPIAYAHTLGLWYYLTLLSLLIGAINHHRLIRAEKLRQP